MSCPALPEIATICLLASAALGCVVQRQPAKVPEGDGPAVLVGSAALGGPLVGVARHPWVALRDGGQTSWERWEVMCCPSESRPLGTVRRQPMSPLSDYGGGGGDVRFHGVITGQDADRIIECVRDQGPHYPFRDSYLVFPGPNSNTFVDWLLRICDIPVELPAPCVGKDYRGVIGAGATAGGTGVQIETPVLGLKIGLTEGLEIHVLGLSFGLDLWPPAIIVPVNPGRIGFDDR